MALRFRELAERIVLIDAKSSRKSEPEKRAIRAKLKSKIEFEERVNAVSGFMEYWNKWRNIYYGLGPLELKCKAQLTMVENIIEWCENKNINHDIICAVTHRAHLKKSFRPSFNSVITYGEEWLDKFEIEIENKIARELDEEESENRKRYNESY